MHVSACINISGNATFGSVVEVMIVCFAVMKNSIDVAQATLLSSMLHNLLFVPGSYFICGGWKLEGLAFGSMAAHACTSLLLLAIGYLVLPTISGVSRSQQSVLLVSRYAAVVIIAVYLQVLYFLLCSRKDNFQRDEEAEDDEDRRHVVVAVGVLALASPRPRLGGLRRRRA